MPAQNYWHQADDIFKCILLNENYYILIQFLLKFISQGPIDKKSSLAEVTAWRLISAKPLPKPMMTQPTDAPDSSELNFGNAIDEAAGHIYLTIHRMKTLVSGG